MNKTTCSTRRAALKTEPEWGGFKVAVARAQRNAALSAMQDMIETLKGDPTEQPHAEGAPHPSTKGPRPRLKRERPPDSPVMTADEVAEVLRISKRQIQKLEKAGEFPIPRLPQVSRTPTYSRELVMRHARGELKLSTSNRKGRRSR